VRSYAGRYQLKSFGADTPFAINHDPREATATPTHRCGAADRSHAAIWYGSPPKPNAVADRSRLCLIRHTFGM